MKIVDVPGDVTLEILTQQGVVKEAIPFKKFLVHQLDTFEGIKTRDQIRQVDKIVKLIEGSNGSIAFEDADYSVVDDACRELRYVPEAKRQMIPYLDALESVQSAQKPTELKKVE